MSVSLKERPESNVPNLDALPEDDLMKFWFKHQRGRAVRDLFPSRPKGASKATALLAGYASNKAAAMLCRREGRIDDAMRVYEKICDDTYDQLPEFARW